MTRTRRGRGETRWPCRWLRIVHRWQPPRRRRRGPFDTDSSASPRKAFVVIDRQEIKRFQGLWNYLDNNAVIRRGCGFTGGLPHPRAFARRLLVTRETLR